MGGDTFANKRRTHEDSGVALVVDNYSAYSGEEGIFGKHPDDIDKDENNEEFFTKIEFLNNLDESISLVEKSAKRLVPIY